MRFLLFTTLTGLLLSATILPVQSQTALQSEAGLNAITQVEEPPTLSITPDANGGFGCTNAYNQFSVTGNSESYTITSGQSDKHFTLEIIGIGRGSNRPEYDLGQMNQVSNGTEMRYQSSNGHTTQYINAEQGFRQNIILSEKYTGEGDLSVAFSMTTDLHPQFAGDAILLSSLENNDAKPVFIYHDLLVWDANGKQMNAHFILDNYSSADQKLDFHIQIEDAQATYPLTIDPLTTGYDWIVYPLQPSSSFGYQYSTAGDINNDGYDDLLVSAQDFDGTYVNQGRVYIYFGSAVGPSIIADQILDGTVSSSYFGSLLSAAGDVNNDNFDDVIITKSTSTNVYYGGASGLTGIYAPLTVVGGTDNTATIHRTAGDTNGDGYDDVIVGYAYADNGQTNEGKVCLFLGGPTGISSSPFRTYESNQAEASMGNNISGGGDLNGDGYDDIAISTYLFDNGSTNEGKVDVYYGSPSGPGLTPDWTREGNYTDGNAGYSISIGGDINNDGYDDFALAIPGFRDSTSYEGLIAVYYGATGGISDANKWEYHYFRIYSVGFNQVSLDLRGDYNGDTYADLCITNVLVNLLNPGSYLVIPGSASGFVDEGGLNTNEGFSFGGDINGDGFDDIIKGIVNSQMTATFGEEFPISPEFDVTITETEPLTYFGHTVSAKGDVNNDGFYDILVGAPYFDGAFSDEGKVFLYLGNAAGIFTSPSWTFTGGQAGCKAGYALSIVGDINNDGYSEIVIGAPYYDNLYTDEGAAIIFWGGTGGINELLLPAYRYGSQASCNFGFSVSSAGNVNGDDYADIIIGAPFYDHGSTDEGAAFVYTGYNFGLNIGFAWRGESNQNNAKYGYSVSGGGDFNNDGFSDVAVGAPDYDKTASNQGQIYVYKGFSGGVVSFAAFTKYVIGTSLLGQSIDISGDINSDGYDDLLTASGGNYYCFISTGTGFKTTANWSGAGIAYVELSSYNHLICHLGDIDGDGYGDIAVAADKTNAGSYNEGIIYLFHGNAFGITPVYEKYFEGDRTFARLGQSISGGDVNGDGRNDLISGMALYLELTGYSGKTCIDWSDPSLCSSITGLVADATESEINVSWTSTSALWYTYRYRQSGATVWNYDSTTTNTFILTGLNDCTSYQYQVQAQCNSGASAWSPLTTVTTDCPPPCTDAPTGAFVNSITATSAKVNWDIMPGVSSYKVFYRISGAVTWSTKNATTNFKTLVGLSPSTTYEYKIQAVCVGATSPFTAISTFTTLPFRTEGDKDDALVVFPNPGNGLFQVVLPISAVNYQMRIFDSAGNLAWQENNVGGSGLHTLDLQQLPTGLYLLVIDNETYNRSTTIVIQ